MLFSTKNQKKKVIFKNLGPNDFIDPTLCKRKTPFSSFDRYLAQNTGPIKKDSFRFYYIVWNLVPFVYDSVVEKIVTWVTKTDDFSSEVTSVSTTWH